MINLTPGTVFSPMPLYQCHKKVRALKIAEIDRDEADKDGRYAVRIAFVDRRFAPMAISQEYFEKHNPHEGGYYVVYDDGYKSFSPAQAFEEGYSLIEGGNK